MEEINNLTYAERLYLLKIYQLSITEDKNISTTQIAKLLEVKPPSATDMLKRLSCKGLLKYNKYRGCQMTKKGVQIALVISDQLILTQKFLSMELGINWEDSHRIAEKIISLNEPVLFDSIVQILNSKIR
ncbi:HTH-type transcriptional regulator MntR [Elizabethkingia anophelis]|uniref:metal-dependent transcriptional regulator n=1 Tax=Elizabethkingia anophelis TaxID=1117645 RepID=UPI0020B7F24A|nr:metal-dependent transcriptional regulator [Elizabethkingia anophelis]UTG65294.1 metal-dependent transcriptional regulator [Elizabethkingia anophelis]CAH1152368.1 HTH-type transcriptional regulator MntR [Elizabethkingia anophelis]CAI9686903.1 HTH-type transcriptional regulator MntR [Elizabethkingia anophelis]